MYRFHRTQANRARMAVRLAELRTSEIADAATRAARHGEIPDRTAVLLHHAALQLAEVEAMFQEALDVQVAGQQWFDVYADRTADQGRLTA